MIKTRMVDPQQGLVPAAVLFPVRSAVQKSPLLETVRAPTMMTVMLRALGDLVSQVENVDEFTFRMETKKVRGKKKSLSYHFATYTAPNTSFISMNDQRSFIRIFCIILFQKLVIIIHSTVIIKF
jgi:hypothetical protein